VSPSSARTNGNDVTADLLARRGSLALLVSDLEAEAVGLADATAAGLDDEHDPEGSTVGFERARVAALLDVARRSLVSVEDALSRAEAVGSGSPGRSSGRLPGARIPSCSRCGAAIPPERLGALPEASTCVRCAAEAEAERGRYLPAAAARRTARTMPS